MSFKGLQNAFFSGIKVSLSEATGFIRHQSIS